MHLSFAVPDRNQTRQRRNVNIGSEPHHPISSSNFSSDRMTRLRPIERTAGYPRSRSFEGPTNFSVWRDGTLWSRAGTSRRIRASDLPESHNSLQYTAPGRNSDQPAQGPRNHNKRRSTTDSHELRTSTRKHQHRESTSSWLLPMDQQTLSEAAVEQPQFGPRIYGPIR